MGRPGTPELVRLAQAGDVEAYGDLVERFRDAVVGLCYHRCQSFETARDLAQDTFVRAYQHLAQLADPGRFPGWVRRIAERVCIEWRRRQREERPLEEARTRAGSSVDEIAALRVTVERALSSLPEAQRLAVTLFHIDGYSYREIGAFLSVPETTVKARLDAARQRLRGKLSDMVREGLQAQRTADNFREEVMMRVQQVHMKQGVDREHGGPSAYLVLEGEEMSVPIQIGLFEGHAIRVALAGARPPRPMTYDLMLSTWAAFGIRLAGVRITGMDGTIVLAELDLTRGKSTKHVDCRPSDAVNLALRADSPVEVDKSVLGSLGIASEHARADYGTLPDYPAGDPALPPLHQASADGDEEEVKRLLAEGEEPDRPNRYGATPLRLAVIRDHAEVARILLAKGADPDGKDRDGRAHLHLAAHYGNQDAVGALLDAGADVNIRLPEGGTPLHVSTDPELVRLLLSGGANLEAADEKGRTALHYAAANNRTEAVEALLAAGVEVNARDAQGDTPLGCCAQAEIADLLRGRGGTT